MEMTIDDLKQECKYCYREVDASGLEAFRCTNKIVNMETSWCRPKNANEPCSICKYCKPREEIRMSIDEAIRRIDEHNYIHQRKEPRAVHITEALDIAISIMRKYQKIQEIVNSNPDYIHHTDMDAYKVNSIKEVLKDGNDT